jgi:hypothetical protein
VKIRPDTPARHIVELSGMSPQIEPTLMDLLRDFEADRLDVFFSSNFKMITRHLGKLLGVMEFVFACGKPLVTINYYLSNGLVQQRDRLWRPAHSPDETAAQMRDRRVLQNIAPQHQAVLRAMRDCFQ